MTREEAIDVLKEISAVLKAWGGFTEYPKALDMAIEALSAEAVKVAYICDGRKCDRDCFDCFRTLDIEHARDFKLMGDTYFQQGSAEAVQGEWLEAKMDYGECSECGFFGLITDYCPNCGARMKGGDDK